MSVTSRTPTSARAAHSATTSGYGRDTSRPLGVRAGEDVLPRVHPAGLGEPLPRPGPLHHLRELPDVVRPEDEVDVGHAGEEAILLLLGHAAGDGDERAAPRLHLAVAPQ